MRRGTIRAWGLVGAIGALLCACSPHGGEGQDCPTGVKSATPSGFCIPRYLSLRSGEVLARKGPGKDYAPVFVYRAKGLPVQVVDETSDWRKICDPEGGVVWVHRSMVEGVRTVFAIGDQPVTLRRAPVDGSPAVAYLRPRSIALVGRSKGDWRQVSAGGQAGWVKSGEVWGLSPTLQCR